VSHRLLTGLTNYLGGYPSAWTPLSLSPALWLDASDSATLFQDSALTTPATADSDPVGGWTDKSGNTRNVLQANGSKRATLKTNVGGKSALLLDGTDDSLKAVTFTLAQPYTIALVFSFVSWAGNRVILDGNANLSGSLVARTASPQFNFYGGTGYLTTSMSITLGAFGIVSVVADGASSQSYVNGSLVSGGNPGATSPSGLTLGDFASGGGAANIYIREVLLFPSALAASPLSNIVNYLNQKWVVY